VVVPVLMAAVRATGEITQLGNLGMAKAWLQLLVGFNLIYFVLCTAIFHFVVEE
jgi:hypothetical protein